MDKPLILIEQEMKQGLTDVVNKYSSLLPMTMIVSALGEMERVCIGVANNQLAQAQKEYEQSQKIVESEGKDG